MFFLQSVLLHAIISAWWVDVQHGKKSEGEGWAGTPKKLLLVKKIIPSSSLASEL